MHQEPRFVSPEGVEIPCFVVNDVPYIYRNIFQEASVGELTDSCPDDDPPSDIEGLIKQRSQLGKGYDIFGRQCGRSLRRETRNIKKHSLDLRHWEEEVKFSTASQLSLEEEGQGPIIESNAIPGEQPDDAGLDQPPH